MKSKKILLGLIILLFLATRLYKITDIPLSVYWDEASIGYNAYAISQTGKDEWGESFPLHFKAFGEYKLPIYIYATTLFVKIFGLNEFSVRFPSVLFSLGVVILTYLLAKRLSDNETTGLFSSFFVTVSPWFFIFSRTGYEATAGLMFYLLGIYTFFLSLEKRWFLIFSSISFILSLFSYNSFRIITPLTIILLIFFNLQLFKIDKNKNLLPLILSIVLLFFSAVFIFNSIRLGQATARLDEVGILNSFAKKQPLIKQVFINYVSHFHPKFLFLQGDKNIRSQQQNFGQLYFTDLILFFTGLMILVKSNNKNLHLILALMFLAPIPSSISKEVPHGLRSLSLVPFLSIILALGVEKVHKLAKFKYLSIALVILYLIFFVNYYGNFISQYPKYSGEAWQLGYKTIINEYKNKLENFDHVIISDHDSQPYIFTLFYLKYPPQKFRETVKYNTTIRRATSLVKSFDKFIFTNIDFYNFPDGKSLIFAHPSERMDEINYKRIIYFPNNEIMFYVYEYEK